MFIVIARSALCDEAISNSRIGDCFVGKDRLLAMTDAEKDYGSGSVRSRPGTMSAGLRLSTRNTSGIR